MKLPPFCRRYQTLVHAYVCVCVELCLCVSVVLLASTTRLAVFSITEVWRERFYSSLRLQQKCSDVSTDSGHTLP